MLSFVWKILAAIAINAIALYAADRFIDGFTVAPTGQAFFVAATVFTFINWFIKPVLKILLSPIIILTLGLAVVAINAFTIYLLTKFLPDMVQIPALWSPAGLLTLLYATLLISVINLVLRKII